MDEIIQFVLDSMPAGVIVFNTDLHVIYRNKSAEKFLRRHKLPEEVGSVSRRIFEAIASSRLKELFPGEVYIYKQSEDPPGKWVFKLCIYEGKAPIVSVFITEEAFSQSINPNDMRRKFKLTRRETDVLRRVLDGVKNTDIAEDLEISEQTVKDHLSNVYMKIGVKNRFELVRSLVNLPPDSPPF